MSYKSISIGGYGVMLSLAFYLAFVLLERELKLRDKDPDLAYKILLVVIPSAIIGAKIFYIIEKFSDFLKDPMGIIFSGAGLTVYGGFIVAISASIIVIKVNKENILEILDIASPSMALGYAIGRLGCHVSGDGCYGLKSTSFLSMAYPNGYYPTSMEVLPTPLFESLVSFLIFAALMHLRKRDIKIGILFFIYFIFNGIARFGVEFIRLNEKVIGFLTQAQIIAILFVITGALGIFLIQKYQKDPGVGAS